MKVYHKETDVLVIGGGAAGARAALKAYDEGESVILVTKGRIGKSGCTIGALYSSGVGPWRNPKDSKENHFEDTVKGGAYLCDRRLARILAFEAPDRLAELEGMGILFNRDEKGKIETIPSEGHSIPRTIHVNRRWTGLNIMRALKSELIYRDIELLEDTMIFRLLTDNGRVSGAMGFDYGNGKLVTINAKSTVLATGSGSRIYPSTLVSREGTGDGQGMAYQAGAQIKDIEQVMFVGAAFLYPKCWRSQGCPVMTKVRGDTLHLINNEGERIMEKYAPERLELAKKDEVAQAIFMEMNAGRGPVYADFRHLPYQELRDTIPDFVSSLEKLGVDPREDLVEVAPSVHTMTGGIKINERCESTLPGLYAAGCVAGGVHGSTRIGGSGSIDALVFGYRAGKFAARHAKETNLPKIKDDQVKGEEKRIESYLKESKNNGLSPVEVKNKIRSVMWSKVGIIRNEDALKEGLEKLMEIRKKDIPQMALSSSSTQWNYELVEALETPFMLDLGEMITRASIERKETRGTFLREDYPEKDEGWQKNLHLQKKEGEMVLWEEPVVN